MAKRERGDSGEVQTLVCLTCGNELYFDSDVPSSVKCGKCAGTVFRTFTSPIQSDEVAESQLEDTARSAALGDVSPDTAIDDVRELNQ